ncbi:transposase [Thalassoroseus pseudoceratinae]|uniref:transposase n=1 Tax=Thalassoroseus pseudoceratinae TaxID=2713176 RepID=UPI0036F368B3
MVLRLIDDEDFTVAQWTLLTNVDSSEVSAQMVAYWYYRRWQIESFFKLLKSYGQELEHSESLVRLQFSLNPLGPLNHNLLLGILVLDKVVSD